jgi:acyl carrier protein
VIEIRTEGETVSDSVTAEIAAYIQREFVFDGSELAPEESFLDSGIVDSMGVLEIVLFLEERFGIVVNDEDVLPEHFDSIERLSNYVQRRLAETRGGLVEGVA